jgi:hypothetical protein
MGQISINSTINRQKENGVYSRLTLWLVELAPSAVYSGHFKSRLKVLLYDKLKFNYYETFSSIPNADLTSSLKIKDIS